MVDSYRVIIAIEVVAIEPVDLDIPIVPIAEMVIIVVVVADYHIMPVHSHFSSVPVRIHPDIAGESARGEKSAEAGGKHAGKQHGTHVHCQTPRTT